MLVGSVQHPSQHAPVCRGQGGLGLLGCLPVELLGSLPPHFGIPEGITAALLSTTTRVHAHRLSIFFYFVEMRYLRIIKLAFFFTLEQPDNSLEGKSSC